jgi:hypothetical protein
VTSLSGLLMAAPLLLAALSWWRTG